MREREREREREGVRETEMREKGSERRRCGGEVRMREKGSE